MGVGNKDWIYFWRKSASMVVLIALLLIAGLGVEAAHTDSCGHAMHDHGHYNHLNHHYGGHGHDHHHQPDEHQYVGHDGFEEEVVRRMLPEELAEEEDLKLYGFGGGDHHQTHHHHASGGDELSGVGLWVHAMGCSLLVSLASLICLIILPLIFVQGKPSRAVIDSLALFGAGAMLGDAFLHQLPHAFGGEHSHFHSHNHDADHAQHHSHSAQEILLSHSHSLEDLSVGLSILAGIILFLLVEKLVRYVEDSSDGVDAWSNRHHHHHHHHHHHKQSKKLKADDHANKIVQEYPCDEKDRSSSGMLSEEKMSDGASADARNEEKQTENAVLRKRNTGGAEDNAYVTAANGSTSNIQSTEKELVQSSSSLVIGYLNLFSDGVHNFTDGMALGSAFLLYGSIGGWSRTLFLLAHELPQEIGDFGILVRSGFTVSRALFFNFLSALVALAGTALALMMGQDPGQSSLIEGFTAGGFIYIAVAGVLAEMNTGRSSLRNSTIQLVSLILGMSVALGISLAE